MVTLNGKNAILLGVHLKAPVSKERGREKNSRSLSNLPQLQVQESTSI